MYILLILFIAFPAFSFYGVDGDKFFDIQQSGNSKKLIHYIDFILKNGLRNVENNAENNILHNVNLSTIGRSMSRVPLSDNQIASGPLTNAKVPSQEIQKYLDEYHSHVKKCQCLEDLGLTQEDISDAYFISKIINSYKDDYKLVGVIEISANRFGKCAKMARKLIFDNDKFFDYIYINLPQKCYIYYENCFYDYETGVALQDLTIPITAKLMFYYYDDKFVGYILFLMIKEQLTTGKNVNILPRNYFNYDIDAILEEAFELVKQDSYLLSLSPDPWAIQERVKLLKTRNAKQSEEDFASEFCWEYYALNSVYVVPVSSLNVSGKKPKGLYIFV